MTGGEMTTEGVLPLNLFHILEEEYVALHGLLPDDHPDLRFTPDHVTNAQAIIDALKGAASAGAQGRSTFAAAFSQHVLTLVAAQGKEAWARGLTSESLVHELNALLDIAGLYDEAAVAAVELRDETREFARLYVHGSRVSLDNDDLRRFNRLLLEDAYPGTLARLNDVRMEAIVAKLHATPQAALCLSGGGIRSGTFSLGVLQGLARRGLLSRFHYLSTVSGGGYIGSWFTAWCHRHASRLAGVIAELTKPSTSKLEPEPDPLRNLRDFSSFTAPRFSLTSADVWSFIAIYLRNLLINWSALIPLLLGVLLVPRIVAAMLYAPIDAQPDWLVVYGPLLGGFALSVLAVFFITINRPSRADLLPPGSYWRKHRSQPWFLRFSLVPTVAAGICLSIFWAWYRAGVVVTPPAWLTWLLPPVAALPVVVLLVGIGIGIYLVAISLASIVLRSLPSVADLSAALFTGGGGGLLTWLIVETIFAEPAPPRPNELYMAAWYTCLAVPAYLLVFFGAATVFVAATSKRRAANWNAKWFAIEDEDREWLGRHGGWLVITALGWAAMSGLVVFGPILLLMSPKILSVFGGVSGIIAILGGKSAITPATDKNAPTPGWKMLLLDHVLSIAAVLFLAIMIAALSLLTSLGIAKLVDILQSLNWPKGELVAVATVWTKLDWTPLEWSGQLAILYSSPVWLVTVLALLATGVGLLAGWVINLNKFSLHAAYRARIIRAFLGASRPAVERVPNPFTGFDPQDNIQMHELRPGLLREASFKPGGLMRLVVKLRESQDRGNTDRESQALYKKLSAVTTRLLRNHSGTNPPSQSLKRDLLEDLNRLLDGDPDLLAIDVFGNRASSEITRKVMAALLGGAPRAGLGVGEVTNSTLARHLPRHGRANALLVLNRSVFDSVYVDDMVPLESPPPPYRLLHVIGVALNLVGGKRLAWQQRRAESFTISPLHCGSLFRGYRRSRVYGGADGISLGTAVTISGAAVSSNMGYHSSSVALTLVLTLFNARLGWWLGNPGAAGNDQRFTTPLSQPPYRRGFPRVSLAPLVMEAFGLTDDTSRYVLLSDGGHFDNLGLYEMVLRRCRFIIVVDGSQDKNATFEDLGAAVRKIRIDLGIEITFENPVAIYKKGDPEITKGNGRYCAVATIRYPDGPGHPSGVLLYTKPAILGDEPRDVLQYAAANPDFPHQTTLDQFFNESQFESYRRLGEHVIDSLCGNSVATDMTLRGFLGTVYSAHLKRVPSSGVVDCGGAFDLINDL
jgi:hypothetical protein